MHSDADGTKIRIVSDDIIKMGENLSASEKSALFKSKSKLLSKFRWNGSNNAKKAHININNHYKNRLSDEELKKFGNYTFMNELLFQIESEAYVDPGGIMFTAFSKKGEPTTDLISKELSLLWISIGSSGRSSHPILDDYYNYMSTIDHERWHYFDDFMAYNNGVYNSIGAASDEAIKRHIEIYHLQQAHFIYEKTTPAYQLNTNGYIRDYEKDLQN